MDIVFCRTRYHYQSYTDFWRLVELAGFETTYLDELEPGRKAVYIVSPRNGELPGILPRLQGDHACRFVWWCLERPDVQGSVTRGQAVEQGIDELWLSDRWLANLHLMRDWGPVRFVPVGSHAGLGDWVRDGAAKWAHMSYIVPRREAVYRAIHGPMARNSWGDDRHDELMQCFAMVNVHQDEWPVMEPLRFALAAAYALPTITEYVHDSWPYRPGVEIVVSDYEGLPRVVNEAKPDVDLWKGWAWSEMGLRCYNRMTGQFEFGKCVKEAVACL